MRLLVWLMHWCSQFESLDLSSQEIRGRISRLDSSSRCHCVSWSGWHSVSACTDSTDDADSVCLRLHADQYSQCTVAPDLADSVSTCIYWFDWRSWFRLSGATCGAVHSKHCSSWFGWHSVCASPDSLKGWTWKQHSSTETGKWLSSLSHFSSFFTV